MTKQSKGLLVLKLSFHPNQKEAEALAEQIGPLAEKLGVEPLVLPEGLDVELKMGSEALLLRVCEALEKIAAQGEGPVLETQEGPSERATLNARQGTLNSREPIGTHHGCDIPNIPKEGTFLLDPSERVVCSGDWRLGTACGKCEQCDSIRPSAGAMEDAVYGIKSRGQ